MSDTLWLFLIGGVWVWGYWLGWTMRGRVKPAESDLPWWCPTCCHWCPKDEYYFSHQQAVRCGGCSNEVINRSRLPEPKPARILTEEEVATRPFLPFPLSAELDGEAIDRAFPREAAEREWRAEGTLVWTWETADPELHALNHVEAIRLAVYLNDQEHVRAVGLAGESTGERWRDRQDLSGDWLHPHNGQRWADAQDLNAQAESLRDRELTATHSMAALNGEIRQLRESLRVAEEDAGRYQVASQEVLKYLEYVLNPRGEWYTHDLLPGIRQALQLAKTTLEAAHAKRTERA